MLICIVIAFFGLILVLIHSYSNVLPVILGEFGKSLISFSNLFPVWQAWVLFIVGYILTGFSFWNWAYFRASGPRGLILNPGMNYVIGFIFWVVLWPILSVLELIRKR